MSENQNPGSREFSVYDGMSTEALEALLRMDADAPPEQETDPERLLYILGLLAERRKQTGGPARKPWQAYRKTILSGETGPAKPAASRFGRLIAAVSVVLLLTMLPVTANAMDWEALWNVVAQWARETFSFVSTGHEEDTPPHQSSQEAFSSLGDALEKSNRDPSIVPSQVPDRFALSEIRKDITPVQEVYIALYADGEDSLMLRVQSYTEENQLNIEIAEDVTEIYESAGVKYYIFENTDQLRAVWLAGSSECVISGDVSLEELKWMIDSIEKGS